MDDILLTSSDGPVRTVTLNRPGARNALTVELMRWLSTELLSADQDPEIAVVILTGSDPAFCAGLDLRETVANGLDRDLIADPKGNPWSVLRSMTTPVIGAINGACVTGGLELALQCSFLVAGDRARFADTHGRVGLHPGGGLTALLPLAVGLGRARQMSFTAELIDAGQALAWGLVNAVVPHDELLPHAYRLASLIAANHGRTITAINETYRDVSETTLAEGQALELRRCLEWKPTEARR